MAREQGTATGRGELQVPPAVDRAVRETVATFTAPGTWLTGSQRAAIVAHARAALDGEPVTADDTAGPVAAAARRIAAAPSSVTARWVDQLGVAGVHPLTYVEIVGVVARATAADAFAWAVGRPRPDLPAITDGTPSQATVAGAQRTSAWVPIAGPPNAVTALSAVAAEHRARARLSAALYLRDEEVPAPSSPGRHDVLTRPQMELVAARASYGNDCFY